MLRRAVAALMAAVTFGAVATPTHALECTYVAPRRATVPEIAADLPSSPSGRSGSEGPTMAPPAARERAQAGDPPAGGTGSRHPTPNANKRPRLDADGFIAALDRRLDSSTAGYVFQLRRDGKPLRTVARRWARRPTDGDVPWTPDQRMHVASISKLITAVALVRLLDDKRIDVNTPIAAYLPRHWTRGVGVDRITFAELLKHETGFITGTYFADHAFVRDQVARGVTGRAGTYSYQNINYALLRGGIL